MRSNRKAILTKIESAYGVDSSPLPANALVLDRDTKITPLEHDALDNGMLTPTMGADSVLHVGSWGELDLSLPLAGAGALGDAPAYDAILRACGLSAAITAAQRVTYGLVSDSFESATCYAHEGGEVTKLRGCRGSLSLEIKAKAKPMLKAKLTGLSAGPIVGVMPAVNLQPANVLPVENSNSVLTVNGFVVIMESMSIELGNEVNYSNLVGAESVDIVGRSASAKIVVQRPDVATFDMFALRKSGQKFSFKFTQTIAGANLIEMFGNGAQVTGISVGESDGFDTLEIDVRLVGGNDDEFGINFGTANP